MSKKASSLSELKNKQTDKRFQRTYGITLAEYNQMLSDQGGKCKICGKPPTGRRLHVDHDHKEVKVKISTRKQDGFWYADAKKPYGTLIFATFGFKKMALARTSIRQSIKKRSVRGLLCWPCNRALVKFRDNPDLMESAAKYIRDYQKKLNA